MHRSRSHILRMFLVALVALLSVGGAARGQEEISIQVERLAPGLGDVVLGVEATTRAGPIEAFVLSLRFDPADLEIRRLVPAGPWVFSSAPGFISSVGSGQVGGPGVAGLVVILDTDGTNLSGVIPATPTGASQLIAEITVRSLTGAERPLFLDDGALRFVNGPAMINNLVIAGEDYYRAAPQNKLTLRSGGVLNFFVRGDMDSDGIIVLTDGVVLLNFLFLGGFAPSCFDAADADDDGRLLVTDAIFIFNWLFLGGTDPPPPTPLTASYMSGSCGADRTQDALDCVTTSVKCQ